MIVAGLAAGRAGIAAAILAIGFLFYEGLPVPAFVRAIPFVGPVISDLTNGRVDREVAKARAGYVQEAQVIALKAKLWELERQLEAGRKALEGYADLLQKAQVSEAEAIEAREKAITEYEQIIRGKGRSYPLDQSDIDWLRK